MKIITLFFLSLLLSPNESHCPHKNEFCTRTKQIITCSVLVCMLGAVALYFTLPFLTNSSNNSSGSLTSNSTPGNCSLSFKCPDDIYNLKQVTSGYLATLATYYNSTSCSIAINTTEFIKRFQANVAATVMCVNVNIMDSFETMSFCLYAMLCPAILQLFSSTSNKFEALNNFTKITNIAYNSRRFEGMIKFPDYKIVFGKTTNDVLITNLELYLQEIWKLPIERFSFSASVWLSLMSQQIIWSNALTIKPLLAQFGLEICIKNSYDQKLFINSEFAKTFPNATLYLEMHCGALNTLAFDLKSGTFNLNAARTEGLSHIDYSKSCLASFTPTKTLLDIAAWFILLETSDPRSASDLVNDLLNKITIGIGFVSSANINISIVNEMMRIKLNLPIGPTSCYTADLSGLNAILNSPTTDQPTQQPITTTLPSTTTLSTTLSPSSISSTTIAPTTVASTIIAPTTSVATTTIAPTTAELTTTPVPTLPPACFITNNQCCYYSLTQSSVSAPVGTIIVESINIYRTYSFPNVRICPDKILFSENLGDCWYNMFNSEIFNTPSDCKIYVPSYFSFKNNCYDSSSPAQDYSKTLQFRIAGPTGNLFCNDLTQLYSTKVCVPGPTQCCSYVDNWSNYYPAITGVIEYVGAGIGYFANARICGDGLRFGGSIRYEDTACVISKTEVTIDKCVMKFKDPNYFSTMPNCVGFVNPQYPTYPGDTYDFSSFPSACTHLTKIIQNL